MSIKAKKKSEVPFGENLSNRSRLINLCIYIYQLVLCYSNSIEIISISETHGKHYQLRMIEMFYIYIYI